MEIYFYVLILLLGLSLGSFLNVIIFRFNSSKNVINGRSECLNCGKTIRWFDLVPILSYLILKGHCRNCDQEISPLYPIVEISTAITLLLFFINTSLSFYLSLLTGLILILLVAIIFLDLRYFIIPDKIVILLALLAIGARLLDHSNNIWLLLTSSLGLTAFFAILFLVSKGKWIGFGDVKLIFVIGLILGYPLGLVSIVFSVWAAALFSIILLLIKKATPKTEIPFGTFLSIMTIIFIIFNNGLQNISKFF